jgi:hypothetical protein
MHVWSWLEGADAVDEPFAQRGGSIHFVTQDDALDERVATQSDRIVQVR